MSEWFRRWFGEQYQALYPHRDDAEAERLVDLLLARAVIAAGDRVVDLACGGGRHAAALAERGMTVTGVDLSSAQLAAARGRGLTRLVLADMRRLPIRAASADAVVNLFTSFGYFERDDEHEAVLREVGRILKPGGRFALDFLNAPRVRATLVPRDERVVDGRTVVQERAVTEGGRFVVKTIHLEGETETFAEKVRLLEREDIERMLDAAGLMTESVLGDYDGTAHRDTSPRLLMLARRP